MNSMQRSEDGAVRSKRAGGHDSHSFHPGDLIPFTRKPLFLIVDSPTAAGFKASRPAVCSLIRCVCLYVSLTRRLCKERRW